MCCKYTLLPNPTCKHQIQKKNMSLEPLLRPGPFFDNSQNCVANAAAINNHTFDVRKCYSMSVLADQPLEEHMCAFPLVDENTEKGLCTAGQSETTRVPWHQRLSDHAPLTLKQEISSLPGKGAICQVASKEINCGFYSTYFLVPKKDTYSISGICFSEQELWVLCFPFQALPRPSSRKLGVSKPNINHLHI